MTPTTAALRSAGFADAEAARRLALFDRLAGAGREGSAWYHVPGRIEVLGKHTDYAGGRSLVCATEQGFAAAATPREDAVLTVTDTVRGERFECALPPPDLPPVGSWTRYPATVAARLARDFGPGLRGLDLVFAGDLPVAAGLSSSSALVTLVALALTDRNALETDPRWTAAIRSPADHAGYLGAVENGRAFGPLAAGDGVGTRGGSQDHTAILCSRAGHLLQCRYDPAALEAYPPFPADLEFLVLASGIAAEKTGAARGRYNELSAVADELTGLLDGPGELAGVSVGRRILDGDPAVLPMTLRERLALEDPARADVLGRRLRQLIAECRDHVPGMAGAVARGDYAAIAAAAAASHEAGASALRNLVVETRALAGMALDAGAIAASAFGAGFGGSVWAIVRRDQAAECLATVAAAYRAAFPARAAAFLRTGPQPGATRIS